MADKVKGVEIDSVREKLIKLLQHDNCPLFMVFGDKVDVLADYLIANGVTVQNQDGCKYCLEYEDLPEHFADDNPIGKVFDTTIQEDENGRWHIEMPLGADIGIRFCPMCGRKLSGPPEGE